METEINGYIVRGTVDEIKQLISEPKQAPIAEITENVQLTTKRGRRRRHERKTWLSSEDKLIKAEYDQTQQSIKKIAKELDRSVPSVYNRCYRLKLHRFQQTRYAHKKSRTDDKRVSRMAFIVKRAKEIQTTGKSWSEALKQANADYNKSKKTEQQKLTSVFQF